MRKDKLIYRVENFVAVNKWTLGGVSVATGCLALSMHFLQRGLYEAKVNANYKNWLAGN